MYKKKIKTIIIVNCGATDYKNSLQPWPVTKGLKETVRNKRLNINV